MSAQNTCLGCMVGVLQRESLENPARPLKVCLNGGVCRVYADSHFEIHSDKIVRKYFTVNLPNLMRRNELYLVGVGG
jgi:hypothetical protein